VKKVTFVFLTLILFSCTENLKTRLIGTWYTESMDKDPYSGIKGRKDSIKRVTYTQYKDSKEVYILYQSYLDAWVYFKSGNVDSIKPEQIRFITNDKFEYIIPDSIKKIIGIKHNPIHSRSNKEIKINPIISNLFENLYPIGESLEIDTLGDGTILYKYDLNETKEKTIYTLEHQVKYFIDKQMNTLPKEEETEKYSQWEKCMMSTYTWENLNTKILMECYFKMKDTTDKYTFNDKDVLQVKIWENVK
jgi:hypothetical protein